MTTHPQTFATDAGAGTPPCSGAGQPAIYVACLASYNNGILHGTWVRATDANSMMAATRAMLRASPEPDAEEWAIHDYEGFEGLEMSEYQSFETVAEMAAFIEERGKLGAKVAEHFGGDLDEARAAFEEYAGEFKSLGDFAEFTTNELGTYIPDSLVLYIDYEKMGRDMEWGGEVFGITMGHGSIHVFWSR